jgi:hypothetical protein
MLTNHWKKALSALAGVAFGIALLAAPASATRYIFAEGATPFPDYTKIACFAASYGQLTFNNNASTCGGGIGSSQTLDWSLPTDSNGSKTVTVRVYDRDGSSSSGVACNSYTVDQSGVGASSATRSQTAAGAGDIALPALTTTANAGLGVSCTVGYQNSILGVRWTQ